MSSQGQSIRYWGSLISGAVIALVPLFTSQAWGQDRPVTRNPQVEITYDRADPKTDFAFKMLGAKYTRPVGLLHWTVPEDMFGSAGLAGGGRGAFNTYCAEPLVGIVGGRTYRYELLDPDTAAAFRLPDNDAGQKEARFRATYIRELFGRYYSTTLDPTNPASAIASQAFQVALWELINESELPAKLEIPVQGPSPFDLYTGMFQADMPAPVPVFVTKAQEYVKSLTGDASIFGSNLDGAELVRMNWLPRYEGEVAAQSQFALRFPGGGGAGGGAGALSGAGGGGGGVPLGGTGSPFGVAPVAGGGVGGFGGGGGTTGSSTPSSYTPTPSPTPEQPGTGGNPPGGSTNVPPINQPPDQKPPGSEQLPPSEQPTNPVPAPPGVILGLIGLGAMGGVRALRSKPTKTDKNA